MKQFFIKICALLLLTLFTPNQISAHPAGGPPFLKINEKYATSNPYYITQPSFLIPMDIVADKFTVGQQISFKIDTANLGIPDEILKKSTLRWQFEENGQYEGGLDIKHSYQKTGSYIATIEAKGPGDSAFIVLDSVQINIVPSQFYKIPSVFIKSDHAQGDLGKPHKFIADTTIEPSASIISYQWDFGDKKLRSTKEELVTFYEQDVYQPIFVKITDSNNLTSHTAISVASKKNDFTLIPYAPQNITLNGPTLMPQEQKNPNIQTVNIKPSNTTPNFIIFMTIIITTAIILFITGKFLTKKFFSKNKS